MPTKESSAVCSLSTGLLLAFTTSIAVSSVARTRATQTRSPLFLPTQRHCRGRWRCTTAKSRQLRRLVASCPLRPRGAKSTPPTLGTTAAPPAAGPGRRSRRGGRAAAILPASHSLAPITPPPSQHRSQYADASHPSSQSRTSWTRYATHTCHRTDTGVTRGHTTVRKWTAVDSTNDRDRDGAGVGRGGVIVRCQKGLHGEADTDWIDTRFVCQFKTLTTRDGHRLMRGRRCQINGSMQCIAVSARDRGSTTSALPPRLRRTISKTAKTTKASSA